MSSRNSYSLTRSFGDLKVRPKLMVLHNLFFLVLTCAAYFSLIPLFESQIADARAREARILEQIPGAPPPGLEQQQSYQQAVSDARFTLFLVLGSIYVAAVVLLEAAIMPLYVYRPLRRMLDADSATRAGDRRGELIPEPDILGDEIGQIMRSRNETVAQLRRHEDELAEALRRIEEQDRLVSLGLLSASVAHELNTPLAVLNGSVEQLIETASNDSNGSGAAGPKRAQTLERLHRIQRVTQRLRTISESLIDFAKVRTRAPEPVAARSLIDDAWALVAIDARAAGVSFANNVDASHHVLGNPDRLAQVFVNLLRNALNALEIAASELPARASAASSAIPGAVTAAGEPAAADAPSQQDPSLEPIDEPTQAATGQAAPAARSLGIRALARTRGAGGKVLARTRDAGERALARAGLQPRTGEPPDNSPQAGPETAPAPEPPRIQVRSRATTRAAKPGIAIAVEDNGPGIPDEVLPDIFDAFVTTRLDAHGTGLGLTVAQGIATQHGGSITASNRPEGGACLEVWLPAAPDAAGPGSEAGRRPSSDPADSPRQS